MHKGVVLSGRTPLRIQYRTFTLSGRNRTCSPEISNVGSGSRAWRRTENRAIISICRLGYFFRYVRLLSEGRCVDRTIMPRVIERIPLSHNFRYYRHWSILGNPLNAQQISHALGEYTVVGYYIDEMIAEEFWQPAHVQRPTRISLCILQ